MTRHPTVDQARAAVERAREALHVATATREEAQRVVNLADRTLNNQQRALKEAITRAEKNETERLRSTCRRLAKKWGIDIEVDNMGSGGCWWVWPPEGLYDEEDEEGDRPDPFNGCRFCADWSEVHTIVVRYAEDADNATATEILRGIK